ncbi:MAG: response regulator transcription factor [Candidatus Aureabacteria bacterium]|nr:response regulator transcription factor [Candidatus Auribacterota bacterium]
MKVLIVEDEKQVLNFVKKGFKEHGFCVDTAMDGREGFFLAAGENYDCIVLDIMLPKLDGYEMVQQLRNKEIKTPVIFLTAKDTVEDKVMGLELGGDDYLVKPFSFSELLARVKALTRRGKEERKTHYQEGNLVLDISKRVVERGKKAISLTPTEFTLLQYLLKHKGEVVTRTMISENVWGYDFDSMTNVIDVHITNLRKKIDLEGEKPLIRTLRGVGYVLEDKK